jgi:uncharacterized protein YcfJ
MKRIALAVAAVFAAAAPAAFAQYDRYDSNRNDSNRYTSNSYDSRDWRVDEGHDYSRDNYTRDWRGRSDEYGRVLESRPLYAEGKGREECWNNRSNRYEEVHGDRGNDSALNAGTAVGAVAGGVLGHQVGSGRGNTMATVGGALLGGLIGNRVHNNRNDDNGDYDMGRCRVLAARGASPSGYDVRYEYRGQEFVTRLDHDPGRYVRLGRDVRDDGSPMDSSGTTSRSADYSGG